VKRNFAGSLVRLQTGDIERGRLAHRHPSRRGRIGFRFGLAVAAFKDFATSRYNVGTGKETQFGQGLELERLL
jgi:hypothetical protein